MCKHYWYPAHRYSVDSVVSNTNNGSVFCVLMGLKRWQPCESQEYVILLHSLTENKNVKERLTVQSSYSVRIILENINVPQTGNARNEAVNIEGAAQK